MNENELDVFSYDDYQLENFSVLNSDELEIIRNIRNKEEIRKWMYSDHIITKKEHLNFLKYNSRDCKNQYWAVKDNNNEIIGVIYFLRIDYKNKNSYFGIYSNPDKKIPGLGRILDKISLFICFDKLRFHSIYLEVMENNRKVINLHNKMGFKIQGKLKEFAYKKESWEDIIIMGMNKNEYTKKIK